MEAKKHHNWRTKALFVLLSLFLLTMSVLAQSPVSTSSVKHHKKAALNRQITLEQYEQMVIDTTARESKALLNSIVDYVGPTMGYVYTPAYRYEFEWYPGTVTYSVANACVMGTLSVNNFSVELPTGYYKLSYVFLADIGTSLSAGYNLWIYDSIPQSNSDNVALSNNQSYSKRNLTSMIPLTSQIINDVGRLFYAGTSASYGQTYESEYLYSGTIYYILTVAGGTPYANSSAAKNLRLHFKKVAD